MDPVNVPVKFEVRSFTHSWGNRGYSKKWPSLHTPTLLFSQNFLMDFCSDGPVNVPAKLKFVTLPVPEIIGGTQKNWAVPGYAHAPVSQKFLMECGSEGPCECIGQIGSPQLCPFLR